MSSCNLSHLILISKNTFWSLGQSSHYFAHLFSVWWHTLSLIHFRDAHTCLSFWPINAPPNFHRNVLHWKSSPSTTFSHNYWFFSRDGFHIHVLMSSEHSPLRLNPQKHPTVQLLEILTRLRICSMNPSAHWQALHVTLPCCSNPSKPIQKAAPSFYRALYL